MQKSRTPSQNNSTEPVRTVRLLVELGDARVVSQAVTIDLTSMFDGWKLEEVLRATRAMMDGPPSVQPPKKKPASKVEHQLESDSPGFQPVKITGELVMGRSRLCDITIGSARVSRRHFKIAPADGAVMIEDLGSANHTWVNGEEIQGPHALQDGDEILAGDIKMRYRVIPGRRGD